jgi:DNA-binding protein HU-beta
MTQATKNVLGKTDLVELIAAQSSVTKTDAHNALNLVLEGITNALAQGNDVNITGFGKFKVAHRPERQGRNPANGEPLTIKASNQVSFSVGAGLKQSVNK